MLKCIVMEVIFPFFVQVISFAFFIQLSLSWVSSLYLHSDNYIFWFSSFYLSIFNRKNYRYRIPHWEFVEQFNLQKVTYRTYMGYPINIILFYKLQYQ
jgi:hypothetical protein